MEYVIPAIVVLIATAVIAGEFLIRKKLVEQKIVKAEQEAVNLVENAKKESDSTKKEAILEAKEEVHKLRTDFERESRERRNEIQRMERRILQREESLDKKSDMLEKKDESINKKLQDVQQLEDSIQDLYQKQREELERLAGLTSDEAKALLLDQLSSELKHDSAVMIKEFEAKTKEESEKRAREIITTAIQRCAADHVSESTVHVVSLPNDEMKGRIIGREGRNIRTLETLTGVDLIIEVSIH
jgi:ribonuclease Y